MPYIQTVRGRIRPEEIRFCQSHEHLLLSMGVSYERNRMLLLDDFQKSLDEVKRYRARGGDTIVEAQPVGCSRVADGLLRISRESGVNIIASTGFHKMIFYPEDHWIFSYSERQLHDVFFHELTVGMYTACEDCEPGAFLPARAGQVKCALDTAGLDGQYRKLFLAAGSVCTETGAPMMVHVEKGADPVRLVDFLEENHIRPGKLIFCHMDRACADMETHREIASRGAYLEYDTIGREKYHSDEKELEIIEEMIRGGYEDLLLLSLDTTRARMKTYTPDGVGLTYLIESFLPMMKRAGIRGETIRKMMCMNPRKAFAFERQEEVQYERL